MLPELSGPYYAELLVGFETRAAQLEKSVMLVLAGTKDGLCPMAHSRAIAEAMPNAELVVYPRAGHMLPYERPAEVAEQLCALAGSPGAS